MRMPMTPEAAAVIVSPTARHPPAVVASPPPVIVREGGRSSNRRPAVMFELPWIGGGLLDAAFAGMTAWLIRPRW
jgi:hypothetical protein